MKFINLLPLAALSSALVIPDEETMAELDIVDHHQQETILTPIHKDVKHMVDEAETYVSTAISTAGSIFDQAVDFYSNTEQKAKKTCHKKAYDTKAWLESKTEYAEEKIKEVESAAEKAKGGHHCKPNMTVYELIAKSKYTTKLAALINEYDDLVQLLNATAANYTVFAPIDSAFEKIPDHAPKPSKEELKKVLLYHASQEFYPAGRVLVTHTVPTLLVGELLGGEAQRLSTNVGIKGLTVNFYSRIIAIDIFGTNGVIHGIDSLLVPPPKATDIIQFLPGEFSTLELGLAKTGLFKYLNDTSNHVGGTLFAPSNFAFQLLGPKIEGFLFSKYGLKYLAALLKYHVVANQTLYSDAYYASKDTDAEVSGIPKGYFHVSQSLETG